MRNLWRTKRRGNSTSTVRKNCSRRCEILSYIVPRTGALEPIAVREYEPLSYDLLSEDAVRRLERLAESRVHASSTSRTHARARHYVGTVKTGGVTIQILPKIYDKDEQNLAFLIFLLRYTRRLGLRQAGVTAYEKLRGSLLEIWIQHFAMELNRLLRTHPKHRYVEVDERVGFLRGKLLTERELAATGTLTGRYACRSSSHTQPPSKPDAQVLQQFVARSGTHAHHSHYSR